MEVSDKRLEKQLYELRCAVKNLLDAYTVALYSHRPESGEYDVLESHEVRDIQLLYVLNINYLLSTISMINSVLIPQRFEVLKMRDAPRYLLYFEGGKVDGVIHIPPQTIFDAVEIVVNAEALEKLTEFIRAEEASGVLGTLVAMAKQVSGVRGVGPDLKLPYALDSRPPILLIELAGGLFKKIFVESDYICTCSGGYEVYGYQIEFLLKPSPHTKARYFIPRTTKELNQFIYPLAMVLLYLNREKDAEELCSFSKKLLDLISAGGALMDAWLKFATT